MSLFLGLFGIFLAGLYFHRGITNPFGETFCRVLDFLLGGVSLALAGLCGYILLYTGV